MKKYCTFPNCNCGEYADGSYEMFVGCLRPKPKYRIFFDVPFSDIHPAGIVIHRRTALACDYVVLSDLLHKSWKHKNKIKCYVFTI